MTTSSTNPGLARWHALLESRDTAGLASAVAEDAAFCSPAIFTPQQGRDVVVGYLTAALKVIANPSFRYERTWSTPSNAVLEFRTEIEGREVHGVDMIEWDDAGLITNFTVMVRPLSSLNLVVEHMGAELMRMLA